MAIDVGAAYERYAPKVMAFAMSRLRSRPDAEDVTQRVFEELLRNVERYNDSELNGLIYAIARTRVADHYRRASRRREEMYDEVFWESSLAGQLDAPDSAIISRMLVRQLLGRASLTTAQRKAIELYYLADMSLAEVAGRLDTTVGGVKALVHRALENLKQADALPENVAPPLPALPQAQSRHRMAPGLARAAETLECWEAITADPFTTTVELAQRLNISETTAAKRIQGLTDAGCIERIPGKRKFNVLIPFSKIFRPSAPA